MNKIKLKFSLKKKIHHLDLKLIALFAVIFSTWLMFATFSYSNGAMEIASKAWSDFASHIPLIRSFSLGNNFPPEYPLFPGYPIRYHFLFYLLVGLLEKMGIRIDFALNIPSIAGFSLLIIMIYVFSKKLFKSIAVSLLSVLFFLFNGSLSFLYFTKQNPISSDFINKVLSNKSFPSFGPYDNGIVSAFWNFNIYTNQRHLGLSYGLSLLIVYFLIDFALNNKKNNLKIFILIGLLLGAFYLLNIAVLIITLIVLFLLAIFFRKIRIPVLVTLFIAGLIALSQYMYFQSGQPAFKPLITPGYLIFDKLNIVNFLQYWTTNLGLHIILIPFGFLIAPKNIKKIFLAFFAVFIAGNLFQFSREIAANHKFINYFMLIGVMFSAYGLVYLWKRNNLLKPLVVVSIFFLIFSGIIDFFPIANDSKAVLPDYPINKDISWIMKNTSPNSVFLNSQFLYDPASLAGRKIFLGWPYFAWSAGYDTTKRGLLMKQLYSTNNIQYFCDVTKANKISYVDTIKPIPHEEFTINYTFFENNFSVSYKNPNNNLIIYDVSLGCK